MGFNKAELGRDFPRVNYTPFDSDKKLMTIFHLILMAIKLKSKVEK